MKKFLLLMLCLVLVSSAVFAAGGKEAAPVAKAGSKCQSVQLRTNGPS